MLKVSHIIVRIFYLLLAFHIVAINTCSDLYLKLIFKSSYSINSNVEEEPDSKSKSSETDNLEIDDDEYLVFSLPNVKGNFELDLIQFQKRNFFYSSIAFPQVHHEIQIPPPWI